MTDELYNEMNKLISILKSRVKVEYGQMTLGYLNTNQMIRVYLKGTYTFLMRETHANQCCVISEAI